MGLHRPVGAEPSPGRPGLLGPSANALVCRTLHLRYDPSVGPGMSRPVQPLLPQDGSAHRARMHNANENTGRETDFSVVFSGAVLVLAGVFVSRALEFASRVALGRYLGPEGFGVLSVGIAILAVVSSIVLFGLPTGLVRFVGQYQAVQQARRIPGLVSSAFGLVLGVGTCLGIVAWFLSDTIALAVMGDAWMGPVIRFVAVALPLSGALVLASAAFQSVKDARCHVLLSQILVPGTRLVAILLAALAGWRLAGVMAAYVAALAVSSLIALSLLRRRSTPLLHLDFAAARELSKLVRFSAPLLIGSLFGQFLWQVDLVVLQRVAGPAQAGLYASAGAVGRLLVVGTSAFGFMIAPFMAEQYAAGRLGDMQQLYGRCVRISFAMGLPIAAAFSMFAPQLLKLLFGSAYVGASVPLRILSLGCFAHTIAGLSGSTLVMVGRPRLYAVDTVIAACVAVLLYAALIPRLGASGAAAAAVGALLLQDLMFSIQVFRITGINPLPWIRGRLLIPAVVASVVASLAMTNAARAMPEWLAASGGFVALMALYATLALLLGMVELSEVRALGRLLIRERPPA